MDKLEQQLGFISKRVKDLEKAMNIHRHAGYDSTQNIPWNAISLGSYITIPVISGTPTGTPVDENIPVLYDKTAHKLWVYDTAWKYVTFT